MNKTDFKNLKIEKAKPSDEVIAAWLMYLAFDDFSRYLLGTNKMTKIQQYFRKLWLDQNNRMSSKYAYLIKKDGKPIALLSCSKGELTTKLFIQSLVAFLRVHPGLLPYIVTHLQYLYAIMSSPEASSDEFYIFMLAVLPDYQNKGLGTRLLDFAEQKARELDFKKLSLWVSTKNTGAIRFYERNGFKKVHLFNRKPLSNYKMLKKLD